MAKNQILHESTFYLRIRFSFEELFLFFDNGKNEFTRYIRRRII